MKEKDKKFYESNKDRMLEKNRYYYENNKEYILEKQKEYNIKNREHIIEYKKCRGCNIFSTQKKPFLCSYCNPDKTSRRKTKELKLKTFLEENNYKFDYNKRCNIDNSCQTYYPDFVIDCNTFFLIIECDEDAHKTYPIQCEKIRENNICYALGLPCVFIRFNPDKKGIKIKTKQKVLKSYIEYYKSKNVSDNIVEYLFY
jgi:hypothetical protein